MPKIAVVLPKGMTKITDWRLDAYFMPLIKAGAFPFALPESQNRELISFQLSQADGLLITGGIDVHPSNYGAEPEENGVYDTDYDKHCFLVLECAMARKMPVLGICRGEQLLNVGCGGSLVIDIPSHKGGVFHALKEVSGKIAEAMGTENITVNSFHHQIIDRVAPDFRVAARSPEGYVEAIEHETLPFVVGVQWHPERLSDPRTEKLFDEFVKQCALFGS